jgi:hypothetical protein
MQMALRGQYGGSIRGQVQRAFDFDEQRAGGGVEWSITRRAWLHAGALFGVDTAYLPETDVFVAAGIARGRAQWSFQLRRADFDGADLWLGGPGLTIAVGGGVNASVRYYRARVTEMAFDPATTDTLALEVTGRPGARVGVGVGYTHGIDRLDWLTLDRITFESDTLSLKGSYDFTPFATFRAGYDFQSRPGALQAHRARAGLIFRF